MIFTFVSYFFYQKTLLFLDTIEQYCALISSFMPLQELYIAQKDQANQLAQLHVKRKKHEHGKCRQKSHDWNIWIGDILCMYPYLII